MVEQEQKTYYAVISDIGGTNARFQLISFTAQCTHPTVVKKETYHTKDFLSIVNVLEAFLKEFLYTEKHPGAAILAIAGRVIRNKAKISNAKWPEVDHTFLQKHFNIKYVTYINDFAAIGNAILRISKSEIVTLHPGQKIENDMIGVAGPGTGLGECMLYPEIKEDGSVNYIVKATEGGHCTMETSDELEFEWSKYIKANFPGIEAINVEKSFCGPSLPYMYNFFAEKEGKAPEDIHKIDSKVMLKEGIEGTNPISVKAFQFFLKFYGNAIANFGLRCLPYSGIYLVGNITNTIAEYLLQNPDNEFIKNYCNSKESVMNEVLKKIPIYIVRYVELGLLGSFAEAQRLLTQPQNQKTD